MIAHDGDYTARPDAERRILLRGMGPLCEQYLVHHRDDGVIELHPLLAVDVAGPRSLATIECSMVSLTRGEASAPVDLSETFPGLNDEGEADPADESDRAAGRPS